MRREIYRLPPITLIAVLVEFALIIFISVSATSQFLSPDPTLKIPGKESEWLTSSAQFVSASLHDYGYLPLWQPYLSHGEPLIDNPFSMVLNPISTVPSIIFGGNVGLRYTVVLSAILAGLGGWALGRMLGFGSLGRLFLGILMASKGNMPGMIGQGYLQLGISQAYLPWVMAGTIGILRMKHRRFPVVLTAVMLTLMFWAGNIYYLLPALLLIVGLALTHLFSRERQNGKTRIRVDGVALRRLVGAGLLTFGLSAVTFLPIFLQQSHIGGHPNELGMGTYADLGSVARMFFDPNYASYNNPSVPPIADFYESFVLPAWFAAILFILLPPISRRLHRSSMPDAWKIWSVGLFMIVFFIFWGAGQNPIIGWLYANVPLIGQWRFVGRMLTVASFWIAVLAAMRLDGLWRAVILEKSWQRLPVIGRIPIVQVGLAVAIIAVSLYATTQVTAQWKTAAQPETYGIFHEPECIDWLRAEYPGKYLSVWTLDYNQMTAYMNDMVRHANIAADFYVEGMPPTLFTGDLTHLLPEYGIPWADIDHAYLSDNGYMPLEGSPTPFGTPCVWRKPDSVAYAFTIPVADLTAQTDTVPVSLTTPVSRFIQYPDRILLAVPAQADKPTATIVQEVSYPGWTVQVDGKPAQIESIGGLIGTVIPAGTDQHLVEFTYRPPLLFIGGVLTLLSVLIGILYLLGMDRFIPESWGKHTTTILDRSAMLAGRSAKTLVTTLTSPELFEPRPSPSDEVPLLPPGTQDIETVEPDSDEPNEEKP